MKNLKYILISFFLLLIITGCDAPKAIDDFATTKKNSTVKIDVAANDSVSEGSLDLSTVKVYKRAKHGTTTVNKKTGVVTYKPKNNYIGFDNFTYRIKNEKGISSNLARVTVEVKKDRLTQIPPPETKPLNWDMRLIAEDALGTMKTDGSRLGQLEEENAVQMHTLKAINPFGGTYLDVVFIDPDGVAKGKYKTNFHVYQDDTEDRWSFTVMTDAKHKDSDMILSWRGVYILESYNDKENRKRYIEDISVTNPILRYMKLIDSNTSKEIAAIRDGKMQTFAFNMNGSQSRTFEWVLQLDEVEISKQQKSVTVHNVKSNQISSSRYKSVETFDLSKPPMIEE